MNNQSNKKSDNSDRSIHKRFIQRLKQLIISPEIERVENLITEGQQRQSELVETRTDEVRDEVWKQQGEAVSKLTDEVWKQQGEAVSKLTDEVWKQQGEAVSKLTDEVWKQQGEAVSKLTDEVWKQQEETLAFISQQQEADMRRLVKMTPRNICRFETHIVEHCNLNCAACTHFSSLHGEEFLSVEEYRKDYTRLSELFGREAELIEILGGEPLLHPQIDEFLEIARSCFPHAPIHVLSNGLLLPKMNDEFWEAMKKHKITLRLTRYPVKFDYDTWAAKARERGVEAILSEEEVEWMSMKLDITGGPPNGEAALRSLKNFIHCYDANFDFTLHHGRLYTCPQAAFAKTFVEYFDLPMTVSERNSIDIYTAKDADEIVRFLAHPIPFCRYCRVMERHKIPWATTHKDLKEWN